MMIPPSVQPSEEKGPFPAPSLHVWVGGRLTSLMNLWQPIASSKWIVHTAEEVWNFSLKINDHCHQFLWICQWHITLTTRRGSHTQKGAIELVNPPFAPCSESRFFLVPTKIVKIELMIDLSVLNLHKIASHFKTNTNKSINSFRYVDNVARFDRRLFSHSYFTQVPEICLRKPGMSFFRSPR